MFLLTRPVRLVAVVLLAAIAGAGWWLWRGAHSSTPASEAAAVADLAERGGAAASAARTRPGVPRAGVYRFSQEGSESAGSGPLTVSRDLPGEALYIVSPIAGGYHEDLRHSEEHVEEARFRVDARGSHATWRRTKVTFLGIGEDDSNEITPAALDHPARLRVGATWGGRYTGGETAYSYRGRVTGRERLTIDGRAVAAFVIRTDTTFTGPTSGTRTDTLWWAPSLSLPLRWTIAQETGGEADFEMSADLRLLSAVPAG